MSKITLVVIDENTLGYLIPDTKMAGVIQASVLRGSHHKPWNNVFLCSVKSIRLASEKDFEDYRVVFGSFGDTSQYEYAAIHLPLQPISPDAWLASRQVAVS